MNGKEELKLISELAEKLGENSLFGVWLKDQIPQMETDIKSDMICATMTMREAYEYKTRMIEEGKVHLQEAKKLAEAMNKRSEDSVNTVYGRVREITRLIEELKVAIGRV